MSRRGLAKSNLLKYRKSKYSQHGEDGVIERVFKLIPLSKEPWAVEFGAWDGKFLSNICNLVESFGWRGVFIESDKRCYNKLLENHGDNELAYCVNKFVRFEGQDKLDNVLRRVKGLPKEFELLSIDIDGVDYHVWESLKKFQPKLVIIEFNPTIPVDYEFIQDKDYSVHKGHSLLSIVKLAKKKGYELVCCVKENAFFVKRKYYELFEIEDNSPEVMFKPFEKAYQTKIWQGYDGELHLVGCDLLLWHNFKISQKKIQVLPWFLRVFPDPNSSLLRLLQGIKNRFLWLNKLVNWAIMGEWKLTVGMEKKDKKDA